MSGGWSNLSVRNGSNAGDDDGPASIAGEEQPACASCKRRKLRCSRETPTCSHCLRLATECVYNPRQKPGLKPGAVEALTRRVAFLEQILLDDTGEVRLQYDPSHTAQVNHGPVDDTTGQASRVAAHAETNINGVEGHTYNHQPKTLERENSAAKEQGKPTTNPLKRKLDLSLAESWVSDLDDINIAQYLPSQPTLEKVADFFCTSFHHWIPYIHKQRLQARVREGAHNTGFDLVLHALVAVSLRHMNPDILFLDGDQIPQQVMISRLIVETHSTRNVSVESLQALIFLVFDYLNNGQTQRAWPLIGSLTRTIDYLQLTTEPSASQAGALMKPVRLVQPSTDWTELEERRRLFWVIFLLDRFCSVSTGWNTSLTADDVHRRLPADGRYFTREEPVTTPYFGIWNKAAARIGRSLANVPAQYNEDPAIEQPPPQGSSPNSANGCIDASKLGAFAYCVEATESLSQVTTFFLQQRINWQDKDHAVSWLTRFKELDLRLVHWKLFLSPQWKDPNISADRAIVDMDPNLTLAHITHNTSMILLHHPIAFPPKAWNEYVALPRDCSAQTCEFAAIETSIIVDKFLAHTLIPFVNVQFSFCAFVAAKALLFDHQASRRPLRSEFQRLIRDLRNMSERWTGRTYDNQGLSNPPVNQAGMYADHLEYLHEACQQEPQFRFDMYDYTCTPSVTQQHVSSAVIATPQQLSRPFPHNRNPSTASYARHNRVNSAQSALSPRRISHTTRAYGDRVASITGHPQHHGYSNNASALSPNSLTPSYALQQGSNGQETQSRNLYHMGSGSVPNPCSVISQIHAVNGASDQSVQDQSLLTLSDTFMDSQFLDMDRVITFEDANFLLPGDTFRWQ